MTDPKRATIKPANYLHFTKQAEFLRESSGSTNIKTTLLKALQVLKLFNTTLHRGRGYYRPERPIRPRETGDEWL